jgi:hypothetical protein
MRRRLAGFAAVVAVMALGAGALVLVASARGGQSRDAVRVAAPPAESVGPVSADAFAQRGIYIGPPGTIPAGVPSVPPITPPSTAGSGASPVSGTQPGSEQLAVQGDPANGTATVTAQAAEATTLKSIGGFVGPVTLGTPTLVQLDNIYTQVIATAWAIPVTGTVDLSHGPAPTDGSSVTPSPPRTTTAIAFVDAVTGNFISEEGFGSVS